MKKTELKNCPEWLVKAKTYTEDVDIVDGRLIWKNGTWEAGTWEAGTWKGGLWENGFWKAGTWINGTWENGFWENGFWEGGTWKAGIWKNGTWEAGTWRDGTWESREIQQYVAVEVFSTRRNTEEFKLIYKSYLFAKSAIELDNK